MLALTLILLPLAFALAALVVENKVAKSLVLVGSVTELLFTFFLLVQFSSLSSDQLSFNVSWIKSLGVNFSIGIDGLNLLLVLLTSLLTPFIILSAFKNQDRSSAFYSLILFMQAALIGVFIAMDGFVFYVFWELALIPIYFICLVWGEQGSGKITLKFFIYTLAGSLIMLVALIFLYSKSADHSFAIDSLYKTGRALPPVQQSVIFWSLFFAFAIKMPVFPFHTWQPDTYTTAPAQGTMLLSGIMLKMGIFGVIRWLIPMVPIAVKEWGELAMILSVIGIVYASCIAIIQNDFKRLIAYSSIAHVGLICAGIFTLSVSGVQGAMVQMISHGIVVIGLFYIIEIISERTKTRKLSELGGIRNVAPMLTSVFLIILLGSVALPFTSGFVGEFLLISSIIKYKIWIGALAGLTMILGAVYMLLSFQKSMSGETKGITALLTDLSSREKLILYPLAAMVILIGVYPAPLLHISEQAVADLLSIYGDLSLLK
jgi:NADH-quinone oxidoreductase subunit M